MRMCKFLLTYFVASATFFATFEASNALALNKSSSENPRITNWNSTSTEENEDGSKDKLEIPKPKDLEKRLEESNPVSEEIEDPNNPKSIRRHTKRCIDPITKRIFKCPFYKRKRSDQNLDFKKTLFIDTRTLRNLFKKKFSRDTDNYRQETDEEGNNKGIINHRRPVGNEDEVTVVVGRNIIKGRGKKKYICHCYEDNCRGKHCEPFRPNIAKPDVEKPINPSKPFYGPDILNSDRNNKDDSIYHIGPIYDPVYYIQNIQREQQKLLGKSLIANSNSQLANSRNLMTNSPISFPQNPLTQYSNIGQPIYYFNTLRDRNPLSKAYSHEILGSARNKEDSDIRINECIRLHGRDFCVHSTSTQEDSLEEPVVGAEAPEYDEFEEHDYSGDYDEATESWYKPLEPLEPDDDTLGIFYDDGEEYYPLKEKAHDTDKVIQYQPKESVGKASKYNEQLRTMSHESELVTESQSKEMLGSDNSVTEAENILEDTETHINESTVNHESEEILGSTNLEEQFPPEVNIELKEKTIEPVSGEILADIPSVLGKMCTIETQKSLEVTKDKTCVTENKQYTFSKEEDTEDSLTDVKEITTSEEKETEVDTIEKPNLGSSEQDSSTVLVERTEIHSYEELTESEQQILESAIEIALINFDPQRELTEEKIVGSAKEIELPSVLGTPIIRDMFALPQVENMIIESVRRMFSIIPGGNLINGIADDIIKTGLRKIIKDVPIQEENSSIEVEEHKVKDGEWYTERVTLLPEDPQVSSSQPPERVLEEVENILSSPGMGKEVVRRPFLQNIIMQTVRNSLKSDSTLSEEMISDANIQNAMNVALSRQYEMRPGVDKTPAMVNRPVSGDRFKDLPSVTVTERTFKSGKWVVQTTKLGDEFKDGLLGAENPIISSDSEEIVGLEPPVDIDKGEDEKKDEGENKDQDEDQHEDEEENKETPAVRKYETGAAMAVTTSSRSRPMATSSTESSLEVANPVSSESEDLKIDDSEEIIEKSIKYYSPVDRLLDYKKNHQNEHHVSLEESEDRRHDSELPVSIPSSKIPLITQPKQFQMEEEDQIVGMAEGSGMFEEQIEEEEQNVGYFEDYEASGSEDQDLSLDEITASPIENGEESDKFETTTVAENENIDDQYTGAVFTEVNEDSLVGSSRDKIDEEVNLYTLTDTTSDVKITDQNKNDNNQLLGSSRKFDSVTDRNPVVGTTDRNNRDDQMVTSRNFHSVTDKTSDIKPTNRNNKDDQFSETKNFYSKTDRTSDARTTDRSNYHHHQLLGSSKNKMYKGSKPSKDLSSIRHQEETLVVEEDGTYSKYEEEMVENDPLIGEAKNEESSIYSSEIFYIPKSSELETENRYLEAADSNSRHDSTYLGRLLPLYKNRPRDSGNSDLVYIGDGVKLPLKIMKLNDGSFSLTLSDSLCKSGVNKRANDENSMKADDQERDDEDCSFGRCSKKGEKGKKTSVKDPGKLSRVSSKQSKIGRKEVKKEDEQYENYVQTLLDVNDIPNKDRAQFVVNALDRVVNDQDFNIKGKLGDWRDRITKKVSLLGKIQSDKNREIVGDRKYRGYDTSRRVEMLKVILNWVKDLVFTASNRKS